MAKMSDWVPSERLGTSRLNHVFLKIYLYNPTSKFQEYEIGSNLIFMQSKIKILDQRQVFTTLDENWIAHKCALMWRHVSRARKQEQIRALLPNVHHFFCHICLVLGLNTCLNGVWNYRYIYKKKFNAFQVLKWFSLLLEDTCVMFARTTNTDVWQATVARAT